MLVALFYFYEFRLASWYLLGVFLGKSEAFKMSGIFYVNPETGLDPRVDAIPIRLLSVKS